MSILTATRRVYSAEELHRLRDSQSQPKLRESIEEHDGSDAEVVKEHVLRGSRSFAARSYRSRRSDRSLGKPTRGATNNENVPFRGLPTQVMGETPFPKSFPEGIATNENSNLYDSVHVRPSPTPSLKKKKVEALLQNHGSPRHVRVTAGGRIVPSEQSPLTYPRYGYSAVKANGGVIKFAPNIHGGHEIRDYATQENFVAQDENGNFCQIIDGVVKPIKIVNGNYQLERFPPNVIDPRTQRGLTWPVAKSSGPRSDGQDRQHATADPPIAAQISALEQEYAKLDVESKDLDKTEALYGRSMPKAVLSALIAKRRELVVAKDNIRVSLKNLRSQPPSHVPSPLPLQTKPASSSVQTRPLSQHVQQKRSDRPSPAFPAFFPGPQSHPVGSFDGTAFPASGPSFSHAPWALPMPCMFPSPSIVDNMGFPPPLPFYNGKPFAASDSAKCVPASSQSQIPQTDGPPSLGDAQPPSPRASHAVPIKNPGTRQSKAGKSILNPMSPIYKPKRDSQGLYTAQDGSSIPTGSPQERDRTHRESDETISPAKRSVHMHSSSVSSFDTADFFPQNTREYSVRQSGYPQRDETASDDKENVSPESARRSAEESPVTAGRHIHDYDWNPVIPDKAFKIPSSEVDRLQSATAFSERTASHTLSEQCSSGEAVDHRGLNRGPHGLDRSVHNVSPKAKRKFLFVEEHPERDIAASTAIDQTIRGGVGRSPSDQLDLGSQPPEWIEGYHYGLQRLPVDPERMGIFLEGYCAGLLQSKPRPSKTAPHMSAAVHHSKLGICPSDQSMANTSLPRPLKMHDDAQQPALPAVEPMHESVVTDTKPSGVAADKDLPAEDVKDARVSCKPTDQSNTVTPGSNMEEDSTKLSAGSAASRDQSNATQSHLLHPGYQVQQYRAISQIGPNSDWSERTSDVKGQNAKERRGLPARRVFSPKSKHKADSSIAKVPDIAHGYFSDTDSPSSTRYNAQASHGKRITSDPAIITSHSRFQEEALDGMSSPQMLPGSVPNATGPDYTSPGYGASRDRKKRSHSRSPTKGLSPAKARFEQIVEKVGIKSSTSGDNTGHQGLNNLSPGANRRRWRDVWRAAKARDTHE